MKKSLLLKIVLTAVLILGIPACDPCNPESVVINYNFKGFEELQLESFQNDAWTSSNDAINVEDLRFTIAPMVEKVAVLNKGIRSNSFLMQSAYACDFEVIEKVDKKLVDISITSSNDINEKYPAGSNLINLFSYGYWDGVALKEQLHRNPNLILLNPNYLFLKRHPSMEGKHVFTFKMTLNDTIITKTSSEILIK